jgi:hypothetical protein
MMTGGPVVKKAAGALIAARMGEAVITPSRNRKRRMT